MATPTEIRHAYRHLYRNLLKAVQYAIPARFVARDQLRRAFREPGATYDGRGIKRTIWFLQAAAKEKGLEHKILKNLLRVRQMRYRKKDYSAYDPLKYAEYQVLRQRRNRGTDAYFAIKGLRYYRSSSSGSSSRR
uniref:Uncharacterized protein n=1 Tax=Fusarium oxysporum (strain Fo5176) TaxID=660025 RepID=A0A0D2XUQ6_FUSOF